MDAAFPLINLYISISPFIVGSLSIFGRMGVGKSARNPPTLFVASAISSCTFVGLGGGFFHWYNSSNLLTGRCRPNERHWNVELKVDYTSLCLLQVGMVNPLGHWIRVPFCTRSWIPLRRLSWSWGFGFWITVRGLSGFRVPTGLVVPAQHFEK